MIHLVIRVCLAAALLSAVVGGQQAPTRIVVVGFDGLSPRGIAEAKTPTFDRLIREGASTMHARAVMPTSSSSNWASMIMGVGPEQHGITSNEWQPDKFEIAPVVPGPTGFSETMFSVLRRHRPQAVIGVFHDWKDFGRLVEPGVPTVKEHGEGPEETMRKAIQFLKERKPDLLFVHLDHIDHAGHGHGWYGPEYVEAVELGDRLTGELIEAVRQLGLADETTILLTADHGGIGKKHGGNTMEEIEIPWIVAGPHVKAGHTIEEPVNTYDTACTVLRVALNASGDPRAVVPGDWLCRTPKVFR